MRLEADNSLPIVNNDLKKFSVVDLTVLASHLSQLHGTVLGKIRSLHAPSARPPPPNNFIRTKLTPTNFISLEREFNG